MPGSAVSFPASFDLVWGLAVGVVALGAVVVVVLVVVNVIRARKNGISPLTSQADIAARLMKSRALQPDRPLDERLAELDDLAGRGVISADEHREARAAVLRGEQR
jgi:cytochrome c-type biogenesis protein CcmH/NrfG